MIKLLLEAVVQALVIFSPALVYIAWRFGIAAVEDIIKLMQGRGKL